MSAHDGGPAFPVLETDEHRQPYYMHYGMSLRDYFAGQALQGWLAGLSDEAPINVENISGTAYRFADAMLKARGHE